MPPVTLMPGARKTILPAASQAPATPFAVDTPSYWLPRSGGLVVKLVVTSVTSGGSLTHIYLMETDGSIFADFAVALTVPGTYRFIVSPGAVDVGSYDGFKATLPPVEGFLRIQHADNKAIAYSVQVESVVH